jgi:hypothetical protein
VTTKSGGPTAIGSDRLVAPDTNAATNVSRSSGNGTNALYERLGVNVIPTISADGYTIEITASPTYAQYVGHEKAGLVIPQAAIIPIATPGNEAAVPLQAAPAFSAPSFPVNVWDGQTIMLSGPKPESPLSQKLHSPRETIFVFITARIVDPAGNPVHTDAELKATENSIPPQPASPPSIAPK